MKITDEKWNEIVAATREGIERWNARAKERNCPDTFHCEISPRSSYTVLITAHWDGFRKETKAVVRESSSGELRSAKPTHRKGLVTGFKVWTADPKSWRNLDNKPASEVVKQLKLLDFLMAISARMVDATSAVGAPATSTIMTIAGQRFSPEETEALDMICRERNVSMTEAVEIFRAKS